MEKGPCVDDVRRETMGFPWCSTSMLVYPRVSGLTYEKLEFKVDLVTKSHPKIWDLFSLRLRGGLGWWFGSLGNHCLQHILLKFKVCT